ncbi:protein of unknown function [Pararobbsia alpina]
MARQRRGLLYHRHLPRCDGRQVSIGRHRLDIRGHWVFGFAAVSVMAIVFARIKKRAPY